MSQHVPSRLDTLVRQRAEELCEYCRLPQAMQEAMFHIDHIQPLSAGGPTTANNLALACVSCSLRKAARHRARDPSSKKVVRLFNPRVDSWPEHFRWTRAWRIVGGTSIGRATAAALQMNQSRLVKIRQSLALLELFPPE
jgi:hypothetical protein